MGSAQLEWKLIAGQVLVLVLVLGAAWILSPPRSLVLPAREQEQLETEQELEASVASQAATLQQPSLVGSGRRGGQNLHRTQGENWHTPLPVEAMAFVEAQDDYK